MNGIQTNVPDAVSATDKTHGRIRDLLGDCHTQIDQLAAQLQPVLKPEGACDPTASKTDIPFTTQRHAELQSYADSLEDLRDTLMRLHARIEV